MTDFDYEVRQRKILSRAARYVKNGSKSKKCTLPSDFLTPSQRKKLNGGVVRYMEDLNRKVVWDVFKTLSIDTQRAYITNIRNNYDISNTEIAQFFDVKPDTFYKYNATHELGFTTKKGIPAKVRQSEFARLRADFAASGGAIPEPEIIEAICDTPEPEAVFEPAIISEPENTESFFKVPVIPEEKPIPFTPIESVVRYSGEFFAESVLSTLRALIPNGTDVEMEISFKVSAQKGA